MQHPDLAAAVASRICHDLVSPVGAIVNGVDLMREIGAADLSQAIGMIGDSAARASALLQFYRVAFGAAAPDAAPVARAGLRELAAVLAQPPRIVLEWPVDDGLLSRAEARLAGLMLLCARSVTGMRGQIRLAAADGAVFPLIVTVEAEALSAAAGMLDLLERPPENGPVSPRAVEFVLAREAAAGLGVPLHVERAGQGVTITAGVPG